MHQNEEKDKKVVNLGQKRRRRWGKYSEETWEKWRWRREREGV